MPVNKGEKVTLESFLAFAFDIDQEEKQSSWNSAAGPFDKTNSAMGEESAIVSNSRSSLESMLEASVEPLPLPSSTTTSGEPKSPKKKKAKEAATIATALSSSIPASPKKKNKQQQRSKLEREGSGGMEDSTNGSVDDILNDATYASSSSNGNSATIFPSTPPTAPKKKAVALTASVSGGAQVQRPPMSPHKKSNSSISGSSVPTATSTSPRPSSPQRRRSTSRVRNISNGSGNNGSSFRSRSPSPAPQKKKTKAAVAVPTEPSSVGSYDEVELDCPRHLSSSSTTTPATTRSASPSPKNRNSRSSSVRRQRRQSLSAFTESMPSSSPSPPDNDTNAKEKGSRKQLSRQLSSSLSNLDVNMSPRNQADLGLPPKKASKKKKPMAVEQQQPHDDLYPWGTSPTRTSSAALASSVDMTQFRSPTRDNQASSKSTKRRSSLNAAATTFMPMTTMPTPPLSVSTKPRPFTKTKNGIWVAPPFSDDHPKSDANRQREMQEQAAANAAANVPPLSPKPPKSPRKKPPKTMPIAAPPLSPPVDQSNSSPSLEVLSSEEIDAPLLLPYDERESPTVQEKSELAPAVVDELPVDNTAEDENDDTVKKTESTVIAELESRLVEKDDDGDNAAEMAVVAASADTTPGADTANDINAADEITLATESTNDKVDESVVDVAANDETSAAVRDNADASTDSAAEGELSKNGTGSSDKDIAVIDKDTIEVEVVEEENVVAVSHECATPKRQLPRRIHSEMAQEMEAAMAKVWAKFDDHQAARGLSPAGVPKGESMVKETVVRSGDASAAATTSRSNWSKNRGMSMINLTDDLSIEGDVEDIDPSEEMLLETESVIEEVIDTESATAADENKATAKDRDDTAKKSSLDDHVQCAEKKASSEATSKCETTDDDMTMASTITGTFSNPMSFVEFSGSEGAGPSATTGSTPNDDGHTADEHDKRHDSWSVTELVTANTATVTAAAAVPNDLRLSFLPKLIVVDLWSNEEKEVQSAMYQYASLCGSKSNITEFLTHGGHLALIVTLRRWPTSVPIQEAGLTALHKAAELMEFSDAAVQLGALDIVLVAMKNHATDADVLTAACAALLNLTVSAAHAKTLVFELHGIPVVCAACATFPANIALQKYAVYIIQYFSYWEDFKIPIVKAGGLQTLADMVESFTANKQRHENTDSILKSAKATMKRLV